MVLRTFGAIDSEALTVVSAPNNSNQNPGDTIINNSSSPNGTVYVFNDGFPTRIIELDDTGGSPDRFEDGQPNNHTITDGKGLVNNGTGVESESILQLRALDTNGNPTGNIINVSVFSQNGNFGDIWGFSPSEPLVPGVQYIKVGGTNNGGSDYDTFIPCFVAGTQIRTEAGLANVENLSRGDRVWTKDHGYQPLALVAIAEVEGTGKRAPVSFEAGAIGNAQPITVSPHHRMLLSGSSVDLALGTDEVLVSAHRLLDLPGVTQTDVDRVTYVHLVFDQHQIVEAAGCLSESFYPGKQALRGVTAEVLAEILDIFPELTTSPPPFAAPVASGREAQVIAAELAQRAA